MEVDDDEDGEASDDKNGDADPVEGSQSGADVGCPEKFGIVETHFGFEMAEKKSCSSCQQVTATKKSFSRGAKQGLPDGLFSN
jgi:hypothetical protein